MNLTLTNPSESFIHSIFQLSLGANCCSQPLYIHWALNDFQLSPGLLEQPLNSTPSFCPHLTGGSALKIAPRVVAFPFKIKHTVLSTAQNLPMAAIMFRVKPAKTFMADFCSDLLYSALCSQHSDHADLLYSPSGSFALTMRILLVIPL